MLRPRRSTDLTRLADALPGLAVVAYFLGFPAAVEAAFRKLSCQTPHSTEASAMSTRSPTAATPRAVPGGGALTLLALSLAVAATPVSLARADNSRGEGTKALVATIPRDSTGWSNGPASLIPRGGKYRLEYDTALAGVAGAGHPGVPVVVGNSDGNPIVERLPPRR